MIEKICHSHFEDVLSPVFIQSQKHRIYNGNYQILSNVLLGGLHRINGRRWYVRVCIAILVSVDCCGQNNP